MAKITERTRIDESSPTTPIDRSITLAAKGAGIVFVGRLLGTGNRFVLGFLLAPLLGPEQYGLYNLALTAATITALIAMLGLDAALIRFVSTFASRRDRASLWGMLQIGIGIPMIVGVISGACLVFFAEPIAGQLFHDSRLVPLLLLAGLLVPILATSDAISAATQGFKNQQYTVIAKSVGEPLVKIGLLAAFAAFFGLTARRALEAAVLAAIASTILLLYFLNKQFGLRRSLRSARYHARDIVAFSLPVYLSTLIRNTTFTNRVQTVFLGALTTINVVGIYTLASNVSSIGKLLHSAITTAAMPIIAEIHDRRDTNQLERLYQVTTKWTFTINLPFFLLVALFPDTLLSVFGEDFVDGVQPLIILAWATLVRTSTGTNSVMLDMTGYTTLKLLNSLAGAVVTIGMNLLLIPPLGMLGAAYATLASTVIIEVMRVVEVFLVLHILPYNLEFIKPIVAGLAALLSVLASRHFVTGSEDLLQAAANAALLVLVYAGVTLLLGLNQEDRLIVQRLRRRAGLA